MKGRILFIVSGLVFGFMLYWKLKLGLTRYFDADEFAYLHWAHNVFSGRLPYRDFLLYVPPGFLYFLAPLFWLFDGVNVLLAARVMAWVVFVGVCVVLGSILVILRSSRSANRAWDDWGVFFLPGIILSFLPLPSDKLLEVRPDNLAMLVALIGMACQIRLLEQPRENQPRSDRGKNLASMAGILYGVSLLVLPKVVPQVAVASCIVVLLGLGDTDKRNVVWKFFFGLFAPLAIFGIWALSLGDFSAVWYSLTKLPFEVNRLGELYPMQKDLFFYPNEIYYGVSGWSTGLLANHLIWMVGLFYGIHRLLSRDFLIAGSMMAYIVTFIYGYQLRHAQYLIPIAVFVALFAANGLMDFRSNLNKLLRILRFPQIQRNTIQTLLFVIIAWTTIQVFRTVNQPKMAWTNQKDFQTLERVRAAVPDDAFVFDLTGATIFYKDPYYVSAVPYGEWKEYLTRPLPDLRLPRGTYIYRDTLKRVDLVVPFDPKMYHYLQ